MMKYHCVLGIDTSNYKTSIALVQKNQIINDTRKFLEVKPGMRGLRQSEAFFQHVRNLPELFSSLMESDFCIDGIAYSESPRPVEGSYMPCFTAGGAFAKSISLFLNVPVMAFSHQEGHIEAIRAFSDVKEIRNFIACHFSGGTCEVLTVEQKKMSYDTDEWNAGKFYDGRNAFFDLQQIGGSKDISFGQVLDRAGVLMGMKFPAGQEMDQLALQARECTNLLTKIKVNDCQLNLSGIDTQIKNILEQHPDNEITFQAAFIKEIFDKLSDAMGRMLLQSAECSGITDILLSGGVSSSEYIRKQLKAKMDSNHIHLYFGDNDLSSDNAVGTALLGGRCLWD